MKNFFKKLSFVMALAMVLTALAPAVAGADASYIYKRGNDTQLHHKTPGHSADQCANHRADQTGDVGAFFLDLNRIVFYHSNQCPFCFLLKKVSVC